MSLVFDIFHNIISFIVVLAILVFIHEYGHYIVARFFGVRVKSFSIGMGKELWGFDDKNGTRWKICCFPIGGYVSLFGHNEVINITGDKTSKNHFNLTEVEKGYSFDHKPFYQKILVVLAGPIANIILTFLVYVAISKAYGYPYFEPVVHGFEKNSPAKESGMLVGDLILEINDNKIDSYNDIKKYVSVSVDNKIKVTIKRNNETKNLNVNPIIEKINTPIGDQVEIRRLGIISGKPEMINPTGYMAINYAIGEIIKTTDVTFTAIKQLFIGDRSIKEVNSFIKISQYTGYYTKSGLYSILNLIAILSLNLAIINLLPIPILDGGYALMYALEPILGQKLTNYIGRYLLKLGFIFIIFITIVTIYNDIYSIIFKN